MPRPSLRSFPTRLLVLLALVAGCSGGGEGTNPPPRVTLRMDVVPATNGQHALAGQELPEAVSVRVVNAATGAPIVGQIVNWVVTGGGGSVFATVSTTNSDGVAFQRWTLGAYGQAQTLEARAIDAKTGEKLTFATLTATIDLPAVASIELTPKERVAWVGNAAPLSVVLRDAQGTALDVPYTIFGRNARIAALPEPYMPYAGPDTGTSWFVVTAQDRSDSSRITVIPYDTALTYRASGGEASFQTLADTTKRWGTDSAQLVFVFQTFPTSIGYDPTRAFVCRASYTITVPTGDLGTLHPTTRPGGSYPGCDPYAIYSVTWKIRGKDVPTNTYPSMTVCPNVPHGECLVAQSSFAGP